MKDIAFAFGVTNTASDGKSTVFIDVTNESPLPIDGTKVQFVVDVDLPEFKTEYLLKRVRPEFHNQLAQALEGVGRFSFRADQGPLQPGETRQFVYPPGWMSQITTIMKAIPADQYHIAITVRGKNEVAMDGPAFKTFIEKNFSGKRIP